MEQEDAHLLKQQQISIEFKKRLKPSFYKFCSERIPDFIRLPVYNDVLNYFFFPDQSIYDPSKGLLIVGVSYSGKTTLLELIRSFTIQFQPQIFGFDKTKSFNIASILDLETVFDSSGVAGLDVYAKSNFGLSIDDIGLEQRFMKHYSHELNVFEYVIYRRSELFKAGIKTFGTSNLPLFPKSQDVIIETFASRYDNRVNNRIKSMFNVVKMVENIEKLKSERNEDVVSE